MTIDLTNGEFRSLLDLVYIGNWILNSTRGNDRIEEYDRVECKIFGMCSGTPLSGLVEHRLGVAGAAIATTLGRFVELAICMIWTHKNKEINPFAVGLYRPIRIPAELTAKLAEITEALNK